MGPLRHTLLAATTWALLGTSPAGGLTLGFACVTRNLAGDCAVGEAQLGVAISEPSPGVILFQFANAGPTPSSITDVYFDNGPLAALSLILDTPGSVEFSPFASPPNLPGASALSPSFETAHGFSADSDAPARSMGVNPGESLGILFPLQPGKGFAELGASLGDGTLRIGVHVQGFSGGGSESFVNLPPPLWPVPEPLGLTGFALLALAARAGLRLTSLPR
jgi:hypothetical protein